MENIFVEFLPPWIETGCQPAFYDKESGTVLQQTARMYDRVNMLVRMFNKLSKQTKETVENYITQFDDLYNYVHDYFDNLDVQEEINNKLDEMVEDGTMETIMSTYAQTKVDYFRLTPDSTMDEIKSAFTGNGRAKVIEFETGNYTLTDQIFITSNTKVYLNNSYLDSTYTDLYGDNIVFMGCDPEATGYNGVSNVEILNGTINCGFVFMNACNITIDGVEFGDNITSHAIQIAGCKDFTVKNCIFNGTVIDDTNGPKHECIQIETTNYSGQPYFENTSPCYDHTGCYNLVISNCVFNNGDEVSTRNYTSIGHHAVDDSNRLAHKQILIERCTFKTNHYSDIRPVDYKGAIIRNNTFNQVNDYNDQNSIRVSYQNEDLIIENNEWISTKTAVSSANQQQRRNIKIINNIVNADVNATSGAFQCYNTQNLYIENNKVKSNGVSIYMQQGTGLTEDNIVINNNSFDLNGGSTAIRDYNGDNYTITNNFCLQGDTSAGFANIGSGKKVVFYGNVIKSSTGGTSFNCISALNDYSNVYGTAYQVYNGSGTYSAVTDGTLSKDVTKFNTLLLTVHADGSTSDGIETIVVKPFDARSKIDARKYNVIFSNGSNGTKYGQLTITNGTTFSWSSSDSLVLRKIYGLNQMLQ